MIGSEITVAEYLLIRLKEIGVDHLFAVQVSRWQSQISSTSARRGSMQERDRIYEETSRLVD